MNRIEIEQGLSKLTRQVTTSQVSIVEYLLKKPGTHYRILSTKLGIDYEAAKATVKRLKAIEAIDSNSHVLLKQPVGDLSSSIRLPKNILEKTLPPSNFYYVHVAAKLAQSEDEEVIWKGMTKKQIMESIKHQITNSKDRQDAIMFGVQDRLAEFAIFIGDLSSFEDMQGIITLPESE